MLLLVRQVPRGRQAHHRVVRSALRKCYRHCAAHVVPAVRAFVRVCVRACVSACVCVCVRAYVRACVRARRALACGLTRSCFSQLVWPLPEKDGGDDTPRLHAVCVVPCRTRDPRQTLRLRLWRVLVCVPPPVRPSVRPSVHPSARTHAHATTCCLRTVPWRT
jgi:hypothetical protein